MKRARMPVSVAGIILAWLSGCDVSTVSTSFSRGTGSGTSGRSAPDPLSENPQFKASSRPAGVVESKSSDPLTQKIQSYVAQFPPDDHDVASGRRAATKPASISVSPSHATFVAKPPANPPTVIYRSPDVRDGSSFASAMAPAQLRPVEPRVEKAASPASPVIAENHESAPKPHETPKVELLNVKAAESGSAASQPALPSANQPLAAAPPTPAQSLNALITQLEASIKLHPQKLDEQFKLRLLYAATGQEDRATGAIEGADPVQGEMMSAVLRAVIMARKSMQDPSTGGGAAVAAVEELRRLIAQQSPVMVPRVAMVTRVNSFGDYVAVNPPRFPAGDPVHVFLYTEVKNFRSEATPDNHLRTVLGEKVEIFDSTGKVIWERAEPNIEDRAYSPRTDFFMTMEIELPPETPTGDYVLKVTVEDKLGATTDQQRFEFSIVVKEPVQPGNTLLAQ